MTAMPATWSLPRSPSPSWGILRQEWSRRPRSRCCCGGLGLTGWTASFPAGTAIITASVVMVAVELATTGVERFFVLRHRHADPGSIPMTGIVAVLPLPISFLVGLLFGPGPGLSGALVTMAATAVVYWAALLLLEHPWAEGDTQADIRRKYEQTKAMTRDHFRPE